MIPSIILNLWNNENASAWFFEDLPNPHLKVLHWFPWGLRMISPVPTTPYYFIIYKMKFLWISNDFIMKVWAL